MTKLQLDLRILLQEDIELFKEEHPQLNIKDVVFTLKEILHLYESVTNL